jgi:hypothetical protein
MKRSNLKKIWAIGTLEPGFDKMIAEQDCYGEA